MRAFFLNNILKLFRGCNGFILMYDVTNASSFSSVIQWLEDVKRQTSMVSQLDIRGFLVGAKCDLPNHAVSAAHAEALALHNGLVN